MRKPVRTAFVEDEDDYYFQWGDEVGGRGGGMGSSTRDDSPRA